MPNRPRGRAHGGRGGAEPRRRIRLREIQVLDQMLAGRTQHQIAANLGISQPAVSKIERRIEERLLADAAYQAERQRARQTLQLRYIYGEALDAWHASKADAVRRRQRKAEGVGAAGGSVAEVVAENQHGDPRYLEVARKALGDLRDVWGVNAPERIEAVTPFATMTDSALAAELAVQNRLLEPAAIDITSVATTASAPSHSTADRTEESNG